MVNNSKSTENIADGLTEKPIKEDVVTDKKEIICEIEVVTDLIGGKWKPVIVYLLGFQGKKRFGELKTLMGSISHITLINKLKELEEDGIVFREAFATVPMRVEYSLTERGMSLMPVLEMLCVWGKRNIDYNKYLMINPCVKN